MVNIEGSVFIRHSITATEEQVFSFSPDGVHRYRVTKLRHRQARGVNVVTTWSQWEGWYAEIDLGDDEEFWDSLGPYNRERQRPHTWPTLDDAVGACIADCEDRA